MTSYLLFNVSARKHTHIFTLILRHKHMLGRFVYFECFHCSELMSECEVKETGGTMDEDIKDTRWPCPWTTKERCECPETRCEPRTAVDPRLETTAARTQQPCPWWHLTLTNQRTSVCNGKWILTFQNPGENRHAQRLVSRNGTVFVTQVLALSIS